jgi:hypothetical protein
VLFCSVTSNTCATSFSDIFTATNLEASRQLEAALAKMTPSPEAQWRSFGYSATEEWRENGFTVAFKPADAAAGRRAILALGRAFRQAAIFHYWPGDVDDSGRVRRFVVPCDYYEGDEDGGDVGVNEEWESTFVLPTEKVAANAWNSREYP